MTQELKRRGKEYQNDTTRYLLLFSPVKKAHTSFSNDGSEIDSISPFSSTTARSKITLNISGLVIITNLDFGEDRVTWDRRNGLVCAMLSAFSLGINSIFMWLFYYAGVFSVISRIIFSFQIALGRAEYILSPSISLHSSSLSPYSLMTGTSFLFSLSISGSISSFLSSFHLHALQTRLWFLSSLQEKPKRRHTILLPS